jgi:hypothetical protein
LSDTTRAIRLDKALAFVTPGAVKISSTFDHGQLGRPLIDLSAKGRQVVRVPLFGSMHYASVGYIFATFAFRAKSLFQAA